MWDIVHRFHYEKVSKVLLGGKERYDSSLAAIAAYDHPDDVLLLHDGVRPLVSQRVIDRCVYVLFALVFAVTVWAVVKGQLSMLLPSGGAA